MEGKLRMNEIITFMLSIVITTIIVIRIFIIIVFYLFTVCCLCLMFLSTYMLNPVGKPRIVVLKNFTVLNV